MKTDTRLMWLMRSDGQYSQLQRGEAVFPAEICGRAHVVIRGLKTIGF